MRSILFALSLAGALGVALALTLTSQPAAVSAAAGKNLKVYPKDTDLAQIKKDMKAVSKATGQSCDKCHKSLDELDADTPMKEKARQMMRMTATINAQLKKDGFKTQVTCNTCHGGKPKPSK